MGMTNAEAREHLKDILCDVPNDKCIDWVMALKQAIQVLEQQPCEDCISREETIEWLKKVTVTDGITFKTGFEQILYDIEQMPSVTPKRPKGAWIEQKVCNCYATLKCSVCDRIIEPTFTYGEYSYDDIKEWYPFCHCGADMRESEDKE